MRHLQAIRVLWAAWLAAAFIGAGAGCRARKTTSGTPEGTTTIVGAMTTPSLQALYKNGDAAAPSDNQIKPFFKIKNIGSTSVALSALTVRYWYTIESGSPEQAWIDYAQVGNGNVQGRIVRLPTPASGADRYLEVSFSPAAGSLGPGVTSGEAQLRVNKTDWTAYTETDDYSYQNTTSFVTSTKVTLYWNGMLVWGAEPTPIRDCDVGVRTRVLYVAGDRTLPNDNQIKPHVQLVNTGFADIPLSEMKIRYWFSRDSASTEQAWIDYAQLGASKVTTAFGSPPIPTATADRYLEVGFTSSAGSLMGGASTGEIQLRFNKADWSNYTEANDASYDGARIEYQPSMQITAYRNGLLVWGKEPATLPGIPGQGIFVQGSLIKNSNGTTTSQPGSQTFSTPVPMVVPTTIPVSEGNIANQSASLVLQTTTGSITCTYQGGASVSSPTSESDIALGRVAAFADCDQACPSIGSSIFITGLTLKVLGADPTQAKTTVSLNLPSQNEPVSPKEAVAVDDPLFRPHGDTTRPLDPASAAASERPLGPALTPHLVPDIPSTFTTDPLSVGYVDTIDPNVVVSE